MTDLTDLRAKAEAATKGEWRNGTLLTFEVFAGNTCVCASQTEPDAAFIAAANPSTILSLIERIERLEHGLECVVVNAPFMDAAELASLARTYLPAPEQPLEAAGDET